MKHHVANFLGFFPRYIQFAFSVFYQHLFIKKELMKDVKLFLEESDSSITADDIRKITNYYALGVPAILGIMFSRVRGKRLSLSERRALTYLGAITGLFDDLFDRWNVDPSRIYILMDDPTSVKPNNDFEALFLHWYEGKALKQLTDKLAFREACGPVFEAQKQSLRQLQQYNPSDDDIKKITYYKGGVSLLFYRSAMETQATECEKEAFYEAGALLQLGNDIFDIYKDLQSGVMTLATNANDIVALRNEFIRQMHRTIDKFYKINRPNGSISGSLHILMASVSRCLVCLNQLQRLQDSSDGVFRPYTYERKQLICDMEKPVNIIRMLYQHWLILCSSMAIAKRKYRDENLA
jgi:hypothetical protein